MLDLAVADLKLYKMQYGTHQIPWDLRVLLYKGGAATHRSKVAELIDNRRLGRMMSERVPLIEKIHTVVCAEIERGLSPHSIVAQLRSLWTFVSWADKSSTTLTLEDSIQSFKNWTEALLHRVRIVKDLSDDSAYDNALAVANVIARALEFPQRYPGSALLRLTRIRATQPKNKCLGTKADKQNLENTFEFGKLLADLCLGLDVTTVRGPLPVNILLRDGRSIRIAGGLMKPDLDVESIKKPRERAIAIRARASLEDGIEVSDVLTRSRLLNLRMEAELLIFIAQTGMNVGQAAKLPRENYRWQSDGEDLQAFRVYKKRRGGDAVFHCYKAYRTHLECYLKWLSETGLSETHNGLFPFIYPGMIPASHTFRTVSALLGITRDLGIQHFRARSLRKTRINWLLRRSRDPEMTAAQAAHSKQTLLNNYAQPHHQTAAAEIIRFHQATDPTFSPPGPGICTDNGRNPIPILDMPSEGPLPDCISPEGCLFCIYHRDVMSADYCWKLATHARVKALEVTLYKPSKKNLIHPGNRVIDRIYDKLRAISEGSDIRAQWVREARDAVRAGRYHPVWDGHLQLMEALW